MIYECEWNSRQFSGENGDWLNELSAGREYWGREREKPNDTLWDCVKGGLGKGVIG